MAQEKQDPIWTSPTFRAGMLGLISGLLSITIWLIVWFIGQFNSRMTSVESDVKATKVVVITLAVKQGVSIEGLSASDTSRPIEPPAEKEHWHPLAIIPKKTDDLESAVVQ